MGRDWWRSGGPIRRLLQSPVQMGRRARILPLVLCWEHHDLLTDWCEIVNMAASGLAYPSYCCWLGLSEALAWAPTTHGSPCEHVGLDWPLCSAMIQDALQQQPWEVGTVLWDSVLNLGDLGGLQFVSELSHRTLGELED